MTNRITIREVADLAGVSASTVSHVVNKTRTVAPETAQRVNRAMAELGYLPSGIARALRAHRTRTIGMIVATSTNPYFAEVIHGVEAGCSERGYSLILANSGDELDKLTEHVRTLITKRIDGLVVMTTNSSQHFFENLPVWRVPVVAIDTHHGDIMCAINDDSRYGAALAARLLVEYGLRAVACIAGPPGHPRSDERVAGFTEALAAIGGGMAPRQIVRAADLTIAEGHAATMDLLAQGAPIDAIFACNDLMAIGAICALHEQGLKVPDDVSIIGYDDIEFAAYTTPPLTTIRQPAREIGARAAAILVDHLETGRQPEPEVVLKPSLVVRKSVIPRRS